MGIKMRTLKGDTDIVCKVCGATRKDSLEMFEIMFTEKAKITICDLCNEKLFNKCLSAECMKNGRVKSQRDIKIINERKHKSNRYKV